MKTKYKNLKSLRENLRLDSFINLSSTSQKVGMFIDIGYCATVSSACYVQGIVYPNKEGKTPSLFG